MPFLVLPPIAFPWFQGIGLWRYGICAPFFGDVVSDVLGTVRLVAHYNAPGYVYPGQYVYGNSAVKCIATGENQFDRVAEAINQCMDFSGFATSRNPYVLVGFCIWGPFFAPLECWCALMLVLSMDKSCMSASTVKATNIFSITPSFDQRANLSYKVLHEP